MFEFVGNLFMSEEKQVRLNRGQFETITAKLGTITTLLRNQNVVVNIDLKPLVDEVKAGFASVVEAIAKLETLPPPQHKPFRFEGGGFMRTFKGDRPPDIITFHKPVVVDSEGTPVDPQPALNYTFSSDKPSISDVSATDDGGPSVSVTVTYGTPVKLEDGSYDMAEIRAESNILDTPAGPLKDVVTEQIQLVPGDAAGFGTGGRFEFPEA